ncbi:MAG: hydantoinase B/oxoprolinase family protein [Alphaproteobacteria bacterium]
MAKENGGVDYFTLEVIQQALVAVGDEMFTVLQRTAHSPLIFETLDFAVGATDGAGELICMGNGTTGFLGTLDASVREVIKKHDATMEPEDIYILNSPYLGGGSHLSDISLVMPVFHAGEIIAFTVNKAHWTEVGGKDPGSVASDATEIYQEGLQFPVVKLCSRGAINPAIVDLIRSNVRLPDMTLGDMWAGIATLRMGAERVRALVEKYGVAAVKTAMDGFLDYGERMARAELAKLPKGTFKATDFIDEDAHGNGPFEIACAVTITDDAFVVDFTGSHPQVRSPINTTLTNLTSRARSVYRAVTTPHIPTNGGMYRPLKVICPPGTIFTAEPPLPTSVYYETAVMGTDLIWKALAPHMPDRLPAGHYATVGGMRLAGDDPETGEFWLSFGPYLGGWGAECDRDGQRGQFCVSNGQTYNVPIELQEARYSVQIARYGFHNEPGGFGEFCGGHGVALDFRITSDTATMMAGLGRHKFRPWGMNGGQGGTINYVKVVRGDGSEEVYGRVARVDLERGDLVSLVTGTGGGYGDPRRRDPTRVREDLKNGYITTEQAAEVFGVRGA